MKNLALLCCLLIAQTSFSQKFDSRIAPTRQPLSSVPIEVMPSLDNTALQAAEMERRAPGVAPRFAHAFSVNMQPNTHGQWETLSNGYAVWRLRIKSAHAHSLNFGFHQFAMPAGGTLIFYSPNRKHVMGPFSPADNEEHEQLWTPIFDGDEVVLEVQVPNSKRHLLRLQLSSVNHDFIGFSSMMSGSCNLDVICGEEDGWGIVDGYRDIIQSVAVYGTGGTTFCTGFLVNNERKDCRPFFITANHCDVSANAAPSLVVYWNFQSSFCRQPDTGPSGGAGDGTLADFNTGAKLLASYAPSDMALLELDDPVSETAEAFFAGWTLAIDPPIDTVIAVHHPNTDEKRISFSFLDTYLGEWASDDTPVLDGDHVIVSDWEIGTTEGGSSGCPLFNSKKQVVGQLHGGFANCGNDEFDSFGWFTTSWEGGGTPATSLKFWLDPDETGITEMDGRFQEACNINVIASPEGIELCAPDDFVFALSISENFIDTVTLSVDDLPDGLTAAFTQNPVLPGDTTSLVITNTAAIASGTYPVVLGGTDGTNVSEFDLLLTLAEDIPAAPSLLEPADLATGTTPSPTLSWQAQLSGTTYQVQVATDAAFTDIVVDQSGLVEPMFNDLDLDQQTTYFWRVRAANPCGEGDWSEAFSFGTSGIYCALQSSPDLPLDVSENGTPTVISTVEVNLPGLVADLQVTDLDILHSWVGDLQASLISPAGTEVVLFDRPGVPADAFGCDGANLLLSFSDDAFLDGDVLESSCNQDPAISGSYQPVQALAAFDGEPATGTWTLVVTDSADEDGGVLQFWSLNFCNTIPTEASITLADETLERCFNEDIAVDLIIGAGFIDTLIDLSATGLPAGASIGFSENPVAPGDVVQIAFDDFTTGGNYTVELLASDGTISTTTTLQLQLLGLPEVPVLATPADGASGTPLSVMLDWNNVPNALTYNLLVATDPNFTNVIAGDVLEISSFGLSGLAQNTTYYWQVSAAGECGVSESSAVNSFTTQLDLNFAANPQQIAACAIDQPTVTLTVGAGFMSPTFSVMTEPASDLMATFTPNSENDQEVIATLENMTALSAGTYTLTFTIDDGTNSDQVAVQLALETTPDLPSLVGPANGASLMETAPTLNWNPSAGAVDYRIDWSASDNFIELIGSVTLSETSMIIDPPLDPGTYFWRVSALNDCGGATAAAFSFIIAPNAVGELLGRRMVFSPNPTSGQFHILLSESFPMDVSVEVFSITGQRLQRSVWGSGQVAKELDLLAYPAGVYLVRLTAAGGSLTRRVVRE